MEERILPTDHPQLGRSLNNLARIMMAQVRVQERSRSLLIIPHTSAVGFSLSGPLHDTNPLPVTPCKVAEAGAPCRRSIAVRDTVLNLELPAVTHPLKHRGC